jgi:hypothetical protein
MTSEVIAAPRAAADDAATSTHQEIAMRAVLFLVLAAFGAFSLYAMWQVGYVGIWQAGMASVGAWQVLLDLVIMSFITLGYMARDARRTGRTVWPFAVLTVAAGSFGPLLYLLLRKSAAPANGRQQAPA